MITSASIIISTLIWWKRFWNFRSCYYHICSSRKI